MVLYGYFSSFSKINAIIIGKAAIARHTVAAADASVAAADASVILDDMPSSIKNNRALNRAKINATIQLIFIVISFRRLIDIQLI